MAPPDDLISKMAGVNIDVGRYAKIIMTDAKLRNDIVHLMMNNRNIMVYYYHIML